MKDGITGVYAIKNTANSKLYVGSSKNIRKRFYQHFDMLRSSKHFNKHLQAAFVMYGEDVFEKVVLETCQEEELLDAEKRWIETLETTNPEKGYNVTAETVGGMRGHKHTEEAKEKMRQAKLGRKHSEEFKAARRAFRHTEEAKAKIAAANLGKQKTLGYRHSQETKETMSLAKLGNKYNLGNKASEETRRKMSEAHKAQWAIRKGLNVPS